MKKVTAVLFFIFLLGVSCVIAAPNQADTKIANERAIQATEDTTLTYGKLKFFVPAGQAIVLRQKANGAVVLRANKINGVKAGKATLLANGPVVLSVDPQTNAIIVDQGNGVQIVDENGRTAKLSQGAAVSGADVRNSVIRSWPVNFPLSWKNTQLTKQPEGIATVVIPNFIDEAALFESIASEQSVRDVEDTLSPSAPR